MQKHYIVNETYRRNIRWKKSLVIIINKKNNLQYHHLPHSRYILHFDVYFWPNILSIYCTSLFIHYFFIDPPNIG